MLMVYDGILGSSETIRLLYDNILGRSGIALGRSQTTRMLYDSILGRSGNAPRSGMQWEALRQSRMLYDTCGSLWNALGSEETI